MNQKQTVLRYMKTHKKGITAWMGAELGILRLSERIRELEADGVKINRIPVVSKNRFGTTSRIIRYQLA